VRSGVVLSLAVAGCLSKPSRPTPDLEVVFDNHDIGTLTNFPVLVRLDPTTIDYSTIADPTTDLRFFDPDTSADVPYDVDEWNPGATSLVWIKVPEIRAGSTDDHVVLFTGPNIGTADPAATWSEFEAVWHLSSTTDAYPNAVGGNYAATGDGVGDGAGQIGHAATFSAAQNSRISVADNPEVLFDAWDTFTLEMWVNPRSNNGAVIDVDNGNGPLQIGRLISSSQIQIDIHFQSGPTFQMFDVTGQTWNYGVWTCDGPRLTVFSNGANSGGETVTPPLDGASEQPHFGGNGSFNGLMDEVRISKLARDSDWVAGQYRSMLGQLATVRRPD